MAQPVSAAEPLSAGLAALTHARWAEAGAHFRQAVAAADAPEAWEGLSRSAWWEGDQDLTFSAREHAYRGYRTRGDAVGAARMAMWVASDHLDFRGDDAVAMAWLGRGRALLEDEPPGIELGFIMLLEADIALLSLGDLDAAERQARDALGLARSIGAVDVETIALAILGSAMVAAGAVEAGLQQLDASAGLALAEDFADTASPGWALCHTVSGCAQAGELDRAEQWSRALHSWSTTWRARHFFGICRTAYGGVLAARGDWPLAEQELSTAIDDIRTTRPALAAPTSVRLGELRTRQGRIDDARALFEAALPHPHAVVGLGELDLRAGDATGAAEAAERVLRRLAESNVLDRIPALELLARSRASAGMLDAAHAALAQLRGQDLVTPYLRGRVLLVHGEVSVAAGDCDAARQSLEDAIDLFAACAAPYEGARARLLWARCLEALGRPERADQEVRAARAALDLLGSARDDGEGGGRGPGLSAREVDILRLVSAGLSDAGIAGRLFLSPHTVHRHVANIRTKLGTPSRAAAVAAATKQGLL
ncbi:MAG: LuxR C-terminal-related transcriptional regulator [Nocardioides sp.]